MWNETLPNPCACVAVHMLPPVAVLSSPSTSQLSLFSSLFLSKATVHHRLSGGEATSKGSSESWVVCITLKISVL